MRGRGMVGIVVIVALLLSWTVAFTQSTVAPERQIAENNDTPIILVGAGDIHCTFETPPSDGDSREYNGAQYTAMLAKKILRHADTGVSRFAFTLGDNADSVSTDINNKCFDNTWRKLPVPIFPVVGNHDRTLSPPEKYGEACALYDYFTDIFYAKEPLPSVLLNVPRFNDANPCKRTDAPLGFYRVDLEGSPWRLLMIDSTFYDGSDSNGQWYVPGFPERYSDQLKWINGQLEDNTKCIIAMWHHPVCRECPVGAAEQGRKGYMNQVWEALAGRASLVLMAHHHYYQVFEPVDDKLRRSDDGLVAIMVGTGGGRIHFDEFSQYPDLVKNKAISNWGVLRLTLSRDPKGPHSYSFFTLTDFHSDSSDFDSTPNKQDGQFLCRARPANK